MVGMVTPRPSPSLSARSLVEELDPAVLGEGAIVGVFGEDVEVVLGTSVGSEDERMFKVEELDVVCSRELD
jgi:hypothetical protein